MEIATFRKWLAEHRCRFGAESENRGKKVEGTVTVHRLGHCGLPVSRREWTSSTHVMSPSLRSTRPGLVQAFCCQPATPEAGGQDYGASA